MPEYVHLLVSEPESGTLDKALQTLKVSVTMRRKERPFWQARYYDFNVFTEEKKIEKLRYMHRNPVVRGLVARPEDWGWSSFRHYATGIDGMVRLNLPGPLLSGSMLQEAQVSEARLGDPRFSML